MRTLQSTPNNPLRRGLLPAALLLVLVFGMTAPASARDIEYQGSEVSVYVNPGEPTQLQLPGKISGGFKRKLSTLSIDKKDGDLIVFASDGITEQGEALIVRLDDGRSYSVRVRRSSEANKRDDVVRLADDRSSILSGTTEDEPAYQEKKSEYAPPNQVSGLMREMMLAAEFGKTKIQGYRVSDRYKGETVLSDGTMKATIDTIFIGANLWGYVIDAQNLLDVSQKINPASFRLDGTRAVSANRWELTGKPLNVEQQIAGGDKAKIYIVTRPRKMN
jgi:hypothetical protein